MPTTINLDAFLSAHTGYGANSIAVRGTLTMNGTNYVLDNQIIGTAAEVVSQGDVTGDNRFQFYRNTDATNPITLYADGATGTLVAGKLYPGQWGLMISSGTTVIGAKATTAACELEKVILENVSITSLVQYKPKVPALGNVVASLSLQVVLNSLAVNVAREYSEAAVSSSLLAWTSGEVSHLVVPNVGMAGGTGYGLLACLNPSTLVASEYSDVRVVEDEGNFAVVQWNNGFLFLPVNSGSLPWAIASFGHDESVLVTRKTL